MQANLDNLYFDLAFFGVEGARCRTQPLMAAATFAIRLRGVRLLCAPGYKRAFCAGRDGASAGLGLKGSDIEGKGDSVEGDNEAAEDHDLNLEPEMVEVWNPDAPAGPEWKGPRGYEPTRYGDWARKGRVSDF